MPEKRELKRLEELAKKKKRLLLLQQRLLTDATLPSMEPTTSRRKSEIFKDDSSSAQRSSRASKSATKLTPTRKRSTLLSSSTSAIVDEEAISNAPEKSSNLASSRDSSPRGAKRSSKNSEAHDMILENLAKKLKNATSTASKTGSTKKSASKSRDNSPHQTKLKTKSRDCSPKQLVTKDSASFTELKVKDENTGKKPRSRDPSPRIAKMKSSETQVDEASTKPIDFSTGVKEENVPDKHEQKLSAVESLTDQDTLSLLKPTIPRKMSSSIPMEIGTQTDEQAGKKRGRKKKLKRLVQTAKKQVKRSVHSFQRGRPKGSKNKKWALNAVAKTKLRRTSETASVKKAARKRTLSGEFELIDERQLKKEIRNCVEEENDDSLEILDSSNENIFIEETCEQLDFSDAEYDEEHLELVLEPSPIKSGDKPTPKKSPETMEEAPTKCYSKPSPHKSSDLLEASPDRKHSPKKSPEIIKILSAKQKVAETPENKRSSSITELEKDSAIPETEDTLDQNELNTGKIKEDPTDLTTSKSTDATENVSCETQCNLMYEKGESVKQDGITPTEGISAKESPSSETKVDIGTKKRGRRPTSIIQTVTEIMVKPSGETTKLRTITTKSDYTVPLPELSSADDQKETVSRNLFSSQDDDVESVQSVSSFSDASLSSNSKGSKGRQPGSWTKKKKKKEVFTYRHKRFTRKKKRKTSLMLINPADTSLSIEDNGDIPVLSPTEIQFPEAPNSDLPSPLLHMPVLMKEQVPKPIRKRGRPRIFPIKVPSGRGRGRPRKFLTQNNQKNEFAITSGLLGTTNVTDPVLQTSISPTISYSTVELDFGLDQESKPDDGTIIADVVNGLVNDVCRGLAKLKSKEDLIKPEAGKIPLKIPLGPRLKGKKGHKRKGYHSKNRSLHTIDCAPIESLSWKLDNSGSPEGSTKLVFKRRKQTSTSKSMSERENSLFLAEVEQLMREKEKRSTSVPSRARQFMLRDKVSRSPLEILAMKDKLEEEEYEKSQIPKRKPRSKLKIEPLEYIEDSEPQETQVPVPVKYNGPVQEMKSLCRPCHVPVVNIVSYVNKHMEEGIEIDGNSFSDEVDASDSDKSYVLTEEEQSEYDNDETIFRNDVVSKKIEKSVLIPKSEDLDVKSTIKIDELKEDGYIASYVEFLKSQSETSKAKIPKIAKVTPIMKTIPEKPQEATSSTSSVASSRNNSTVSSKNGDSNELSTSSTGVVPPSAHQPQQTVSGTSDASSSSTQLYSCKACDFSSPAKNQIENHVYTHISHVAFRCASCNSQDKTLAAAQRHQNAAHPHSNQNIIKIPRVREEDYYRTETKANQPLYVSLVVQGNFSLNAASIRNQSNRFVCTHCQYSTNINEDIDQHVQDMHRDQELFVCTLCDRAMYHSKVQIQAHCQQTHPSRPDCFRKLPHFYDCELTDSSERGRTDSRGNIFDRMTNFLNPVQSSNDQNTDSDRIRCAKEYLNIQDSINKIDTEAGSTSPTDDVVQTSTMVEEVSESSTNLQEILDDTPKDIEVADVGSTSTPEFTIQTPKEHSIARSILQGKTVVDKESANEQTNSNNSSIQIASTSISQGPDGSSLSTTRTTKIVDGDQQQDGVNILSGQGKNSNISINSNVTVSQPKPNDEQPIEESDNGLGGLKIISVVSLQGQEFIREDSSTSKKESNSGRMSISASPLVIPRPNINVPQKQKLLLPKPSPTLVQAVEKKPAKPKDILPKAPVSVDDIVLRNERLTCTYKCKTCSVHAPFLSVIVEHLMQHHQSICVFTCPYCKISEGKKPDFKTEAQARDHIAKHHPSYFAKKDTSLSDSAKEIVQVVAIPSSSDFQRGKTSNIERDIYMCQKCSTHMPSLSYMYSHIENEHDDVFLHVCPECKKYKHKSEDVVFKHVMDVHLKDPSTVDLSLAMEDNLFTRIFSISKNAMYCEKSHTAEDPNLKSNVNDVKQSTASEIGESSRQNLALSTATPNVVKKRPTARKSIKRVDDIAEARAIMNASAVQSNKTQPQSPSPNQPRPIIGSQLFTDCATVTTSTTKAVSALVPVIVSQAPPALPRKQPIPTPSSILQTKQKQNYIHLSVDEASQLAKQKHLPVGYKTVAQQLKERKLMQMQTAANQQCGLRRDVVDASTASNLHLSEHYFTTSEQNESVQSKKFSMTDRLHRLHKSGSSTASTAVLNIPKPVLNIPSMDKIRSVARPKSLPSASETSVDLTLAQEMSNYPGILRPPAASSSSPRSQPVFPMNTAPKGPSPRPQPSLLFPRGLNSPSPSPKLPVKSPAPIDADDDPEAFKIFNLKPSKSPAPPGKPPQTPTPPVPNLKGPFPQLINLPAGIQFPQIPINIAGQSGQISNIFTQGFPGVVLLQPQALNNPAVVSAVNTFGVESQGFTGVNTFKCPYCSTVLERNAVRPHIEGMHKGCAVIYKPLGM
ncbi:hypothetical protein LOTGIDRAFT_239613 [Lottia gigantea]|uniref:C2H2-type domain-containing protein n=1 Tax=Lottia gigantea TaxID=225164 RepID=V4A5J2_LOTGI|nr:hypothetical protein LOTGIDRAFT_239613 [Lottia gigantea]ESO88526.1 hypothetical protein LOTGIDRAFT_239613 [Lottia gigantea]